jgi:hypothetical protein
MCDYAYMIHEKVYCDLFDYGCITCDEHIADCSIAEWDEMDDDCDLDYETAYITEEEL